MTERSELILGMMEDIVSDLLYYDRKEDDELPQGAIEEALDAEELDVDEIVAAFKKALYDGLGYVEEDDDE